MGNIEIFNPKGKTSAEVASFLQLELLSLLFDAVPAARDSGLVILYGSAARGEAREGSDIDVMLFLPLELVKANFKYLRKFSGEVWEKLSVDFSFSIYLDTLISDQAWNNDFLLHLLQEATVLHDPQNIFPGRKQQLTRMLPDVQKQKIISAGWEIVKLLARLARSSAKDDQLGIVALRVKIIKINMILINLKYGRFFDAHNLYNKLKDSNIMGEYLPLIDNCIQHISDQQCEKAMAELTEKVQKDLVADNLLPPKYYAGGKWWLNPPRYTISREWE